MLKPRVVLLTALVLTSSGIVASFAVASREADDQLADGVSIEGIDVGGLSPDAALERVWQTLRRPAMRSVRVRVAGRTHVLTAREARVRLRLPDAVESAHAASREGSFLERGWRQLTGGEVSHDIDVRPAASHAAVREFVGGIEQDVGRPAVDARLSIAVDRVTVVAERPGRRLAGSEQLVKRIARAFSEPSSSRDFSGRVAAVAPQVTRDDVWERTPTVVTVSRSGRQARLFRRGQLVTSYRVAVGQPGYPTPLGRFAVQTMQKNPVWNVPDSEWAGKLAGQTIPAGDPRNPLIARWIGFDGAVGFHGTKSLESLGRAASRGCVRMRPADIIELFTRVQVGTPVLVAR
jgi:lipoprotein-anchoring transpeptidase ErfK/SrfK